MVVAILVAFFTFLVGFIAGRAQAISIIEEIIDAATRLKPPIVVVQHAESEETEQTEDRPWKGN